MTTRATIRVACRLGISPERLFDAWLAPEVAGKWLFASASRPLAHAEIDARVAGGFRFVESRDDATIEHTGKYLEVARPRRLVFALHAGSQLPVGTRVTVEIVPAARHSHVTVIHENLPADAANRMECRWTGMLYGLGATLAGGNGRPAPVLFRKGPMRGARGRQGILVPAKGRTMSKSSLPQRLQSASNIQGDTRCDS